MRGVATSMLFMLVLTAGSGCGGNDAPSTEETARPTATASNASAANAPAPLRGAVTVFAAASLTDAFHEIGSAFQEEHPGVRVRFNFAASTALRTQLEQGARADVFASADRIQMENAHRAGVLDDDERIFAKNKLVVIVPLANPAAVLALSDLARPGLKLVLTDGNVPIGQYARVALKQMSADPQFGPDFSRKVLANLRSEEANVRAVVTKVQLGEADAGIVYASDVTPAVSGQVRSVLIPDQFNTIATYPIALVKNAPNRAAGRALIAFVRSPKGQEILRGHNFIVDAETGAARLLPVGGMVAVSHGG